MIKVVIIDDKIERMNHFLKKRNLNFFQFPFLKVCNTHNLVEIKEDVKSETFRLFEGMEIIMTHRSYWSQIELDILKNYCSKMKSLLVPFSGGSNTTHYSEYPARLLTIDVSQFYNDRLIIFLRNYKENSQPDVRILQYGEKWKLNILFECRNSIAVFQQKYPSISIFKKKSPQLILPKEFVNMCHEFNLDITWYTDGLDSDATWKLANFRNNITDIIKREIF